MRYAKRGEVYAFLLPDGRWGAAQVLGLEPGARKFKPTYAELAPLDVIWETPDVAGDAWVERVRQNGLAARFTLRPPVGLLETLISRLDRA